MTPFEQSELEQAQAFVVEYYPSMWRSFYRNLLKEGFTVAESFSLLKTYIMAQGGDRKPDDYRPPETKNVPE